MKRFKEGLIVGKFSPLHRGHEALIRRGMEECESLVVLTYSRPEFKRCEVESRVRWFSELFPQVRLIAMVPGEVPENSASEEAHRNFVAEVCGLHDVSPDVVLTSETYGDGFAESLSKRLGHPVAHVLVDLDRKQVPISGTRFRADPHGLREWVSPRVYADFVETVCFLGAESTGKSTLSNALARAFQTVAVAEYGRTLWEEKSGRLEADDFPRIVETHVAQEEAARLRARQFVFVDTSPLTTLFYAQESGFAVDPRFAAWSARKYDHVFLCWPDFPLVQDGTRSDEAFRARQHAWYRTELARRRVPYTELQGSLEERLSAVEARLTWGAMIGRG